MRIRLIPSLFALAVVSLSAAAFYLLTAQNTAARDRAVHAQSPAHGGPHGELRAPRAPRQRAARTEREEFQPLFPNFLSALFRPGRFAEEPAARRGRAQGFGELDGAIARHAMAAGVPLELAHRVVKRESGGNPRVVSKGNYGLMQIRLGTAQAMGYRGNAQGLLDPDTNMTYAMKYLAGAYRAAGGSHDGAIRLYSRGYYHEAKRQGFSAYDPPPAGVQSFGRRFAERQD